jgi:membrane protease YdiL (CAAX protease family)
VLAVVVAHLAAVLGAGVVYTAGGWKSGAVPQWATLLAVLPFWAGVGAIAVKVSAGGGARSVLGERPAPLAVIGAAALGVLVQLLLPFVYVPILKLSGTSVDQLDLPARRLFEGATGINLVSLIIVACVGAPVCEEVLYRGVMLRGLRRTRRWVAVLVTAALFAALHFQVLQFPGLLVFGLVAGALSILGDGVALPIAAHVGFNAAAVIALQLKYG